MNLKTRFAVRTPVSIPVVTRLTHTARRRALTLPPSRNPFSYLGATNQTSSGSTSRRRSPGWSGGQRTTTGWSPPGRPPTDTRPLRAVLRRKSLRWEEEQGNAAVQGVEGPRASRQGGQALARSQVHKVSLGSAVLPLAKLETCLRPWMVAGSFIKLRGGLRA